MKDVLDLDLQLFLRNLLPEEHAVLQEMRVFAEEHHIPVVDPEVGNLLHILTGLVQPENILEIGTAIGCSTIAMAQAMDCGRITTIELTEENERKLSIVAPIKGVYKEIYNVLQELKGECK